jgi:hypothetical protein
MLRRYEGTCDITSASAETVGQLYFKIQPVSDGKVADMAEAVAQASHLPLTSPPPAVQFFGEVAQRAESVVEQASKFSGTINDICGKLEFLQNLGDKLSEVRYYSARYAPI